MIHISHRYDYRTAHQQAWRVNWQIDDIIGGEKTLDFSQPFLPDTWVDANALTFLSEADRLTVNHIRSHSYLYLFGFVEEYILPFVVEHVQSRIHKARQDELQALLHFAEEEAKHIELFQRFAEDFHAGFGTACDVIGPPEAVAKVILGKSTLGVALSILHLEWMTQLHYVASAQDNVGIDPQFRSLLRHHWVEEAQHAKLDTLMVESIAQTLNEDEIQAGIEDYLDIGGIFDEGFIQQVEKDFAALTRATGRTLPAQDAEQYRAVQLQSYRKTFLTAGMRHAKFQSVVHALSAEGARQVNEVAECLVPSATAAPCCG
jgi:hypothetical protein